VPRVAGKYTIEDVCAACARDRRGPSGHDDPEDAHPDDHGIARTRASSARPCPTPQACAVVVTSADGGGLPDAGDSEGDEGDKGGAGDDGTYSGAGSGDCDRGAHAGAGCADGVNININVHHHKPTGGAAALLCPPSVFPPSVFSPCAIPPPAPLSS